MLKKHKLSWPAVVLACVAIMSLALVLTLAPAEVRGPVIEWLGWGVAGVGTFLAPIVRRKLDHETKDGDDGE